MADIPLADLTERQRYWLITGSVGPRPIGLVTSRAADGLCNAAPFSTLTYLSEKPALMVIAIDCYGDESHRPGEDKDTLRNIKGGDGFVVNMVDEAILEQAVRCGSDFPAHVSEAEAVGFTLLPSAMIPVSRIAEAPISWECKVFQMLEIAGQRTIVIGEILSIHIRDDLLDPDALRIRVDRFAPVGRLGGPNYTRTLDRLRLPVPTHFPSQGSPRS